MRLKLLQPLAARLSMVGILPEAIMGKDTAAVARMAVRYGNQLHQLGEFFHVIAINEKSAATPAIPVLKLIVEADSERIDSLGAGLTEGEIEVLGSVGFLLGKSMTGGKISVSGNAGYGAGLAMAGGEISIAGDAGDCVGGMVIGGQESMRGGMIKVAGRVGANLASRMKGGTILIGGGIGVAAATRMQGGTIVIGSKITHDASESLAVLMQRGTVWLLAPKSLNQSMVPLLPTIVPCGSHDLVVLRLLQKQIANEQFPAFATSWSQSHAWQRAIGDRACGGMGEIWYPQ